MLNTSKRKNEVATQSPINWTHPRRTCQCSITPPLLRTHPYHTPATYINHLDTSYYIRNYIKPQKGKSGAPDTKKGLPLWRGVQFKWTCTRDQSSWTNELVRIPPVDHLYTLYIVFKISRAQKMQDRSKPQHFGQASQIRMTCQWTRANHNDYGLTRNLTPNKWHLNTDIDTMNLEKITQPSKWPSGHQTQGITRPEVHQHSYELHCTVLTCQGLYRFHQWTNSIQYI